mgnify:CR=1 FL=1
MAEKLAGAYQTISEVSSSLNLPAHVLRFWESKFPQLKPMKRSGGRRYYRPEDIETLREIKTLLYQEGFTIKGAKKALATRKNSKAGQTTQETTATAHSISENSSFLRALTLLNDAETRIDRLLA